MASIAAAPTASQERISELDIIRGFALFGVFWINMTDHVGYVVPPEHAAALASAPVDEVVEFVARWLMGGKALALFSMLFGFGFAIFYDRASARGVDATRLYLRRLTILLLIGLAHVSLVWFGDVLHQYAIAGFLLLATRRWPSWLLFALGVALAVLLMPLVAALASLVYAGLPPWHATWEEAQQLRWVVFLGSDYLAYVAANVRSVWIELYAVPLGYFILAFIFGRFLLGGWIYRQGWLQNPEAHAAGFRRWAPILILSGLLLSGLRPFLGLAGLLDGALGQPARWLQEVGTVLLALGYGAGLVLLCRSPAWRRRLGGLGAVGQMALTNYIGQSLAYMFVLYGLGLGLMASLGATLGFAIVLVAFGLQMLFSLWWLARYRFGPLEWLWRSATYGEWQRLRRQERAPAPAAAE